MSCQKVVRLIFADFPTGLIVDALGTPSFGKHIHDFDCCTR